jgi:hypothetical protein
MRFASSRRLPSLFTTADSTGAEPGRDTADLVAFRCAATAEAAATAPATAGMTRLPAAACAAAVHRPTDAGGRKTGHIVLADATGGHETAARPMPGRALRPGMMLIRPEIGSRRQALAHLSVSPG